MLWLKHNTNTNEPTLLLSERGNTSMYNKYVTIVSIATNMRIALCEKHSKFVLFISFYELLHCHIDCMTFITRHLMHAMSYLLHHQMRKEGCLFRNKINKKWSCFNYITNLIYQGGGMNKFVKALWIYIKLQFSNASDLYLGCNCL